MGTRQRPVVVKDLPQTPEEMRALASRLICPLCGRGTFKALAVHAARAHGISGKGFCDLLEVTFRTHFVDEDLRERWRQQARDAENTVRLRESSRGRIATWSKAGKAAQVATGLANGRACTPEQLQRMRQTANAPEARARAAKTVRANRIEVEHGLTRYFRGCRCPLCAEAFRAYQRDGYSKRTRIGACDVCGSAFEVYRYSARTRCYSCEPSTRRIDDPDHGTRARYKRLKCRCDECRSWNRDQSRRRRQVGTARRTLERILPEIVAAAEDLMARRAWEQSEPEAWRP